jgi:hypothetical protein
LALAAACGSDDTRGAPGGDAGGADATSGPDGGIDVATSPPDALAPVFDSTTGARDAFESDAPFAFDGFARPDGWSDAEYCPDDDHDGFTICDGDCNDHNSLVNPCAFDTNAASGDPVGSDGLDNDCDGTIDNRRLCDSSLPSGHDTNPTDYARAIDICESADPRCPSVISATWYGPQSANARRVTAHMGNTFTPHAGSKMAFFSSGIADDDVDTPAYRTGDGTDLGNTYVHPSPLSAAQNVNPCGTGVDESTVSVHDYTELRLTLRAPINAGSFTFDFNFFSEEYPAYVCRGFNDTFLTMLTSLQYPAGFQITYDPSGHRINVNNAFFQDCTSIVSGDGLGYTHACSGSLTPLAATGYEIAYCCSPLTNGNVNKGSGATDWLKTTAPIHPGETFTVSFVVFDEHDGILDSAAILDNFRWNSTTLGSPVTGR